MGLSRQQSGRGMGAAGWPVGVGLSLPTPWGPSWAQNPATDVKECPLF